MQHSVISRELTFAFQNPKVVFSVLPFLFAQKQYTQVLKLSNHQLSSINHNTDQFWLGTPISHPHISLRVHLSEVRWRFLTETWSGERSVSNLNTDKSATLQGVAASSHGGRQAHCRQQAEKTAMIDACYVSLFFKITPHFQF